MKTFALRCVTVALLLSSGHANAVPEGIWVREQNKKECCAPRLELTAAGEAFCLEGDDPVAGTVHEVEGKMQVEVAGKIRWILSPEGSGWIDQEKRHWATRESLVKTDPSWTIVRIRVVDQYGKPVEEFGYDYRIGAKDGDWDPMLVRPLRGKGGLLEIKAPDECKISLSIDNPDFNRGYGTGRELDRKKGAATLEAKFDRGHTIRGQVVNGATGKPLAGAAICPLVFTPPSFSADAGRSITTGADGVFELRGVKFGFAVSHPDCLSREINLDVKHLEEPVQVWMKAGITIQGTVSDPANRALAGVAVSGSGKEATTGGNGRFVMKGLYEWKSGVSSLHFSKDGYGEADFTEGKVPAEGLAITLAPLPELRGQVLRADGTPAKRYRIVCGPEANPEDYECVKAEVEDNEGRFVVRPKKLSKEGGKYWLGIRAEGAAPWDEVVSLATMNHGGFRIGLKDGVTFSATLALPASAQEPIEAALEPTDRASDGMLMVLSRPAKELASEALTMKRGEVLRIPHLRAGEYQLKILSKGASPLLRSVRIGSDDMALGELRIDGTGSISGIVNQPDGKEKIWRFADGLIFVASLGNDLSEPYLTFKTDAAGRFRVDRVPVGAVTVSFKFKVSADIVNGVSREARVAEGKNTEVRFEGHGGAWSQPLRLLFDGKERIPVSKGLRKVENVTDRAPEFRFEATALDSGPVSGTRSTDWSADEKRGAAIDDLSSGRWRIRVFDWLGSSGFEEGWRAEAIAEVGAKREPIVFRLGGKTFSGKLTAARETNQCIQVIAVEKAGGRAFLSRCDSQGAFVIRYLPQGEYLLHAHEDTGGWCDLGHFQLDKAVVDCGDHALLDGGHAEGKLDRSLLARRDAIHIFASAPDGVEIPADDVKEDGSYRFGHLRPGRWTIVTRSDEAEISRQPVEIKAGETVKLGR